MNDLRDADPHLIEQAAHWMARLWADDASPQDQESCLHWRNESPAHEHAWQCLQRISGKFSSVPTGQTHGQLLISTRNRSLPRRQLLQWGALGIGLAATGYGLDAPQHWRSAMAGQRTRVGEIHRLTLEDKTRLTLNTDTALDIAYTPGQRRISLHHGEILVETRSDPLKRPFSVETRHARLVAHGTRFSVRHERNQTRLSVIDGQVEVQPRARLPGHVLDAGEYMALDSQRLGPVLTFDPQTLRWHEGLLVAERMRLAELLGELGRYRHGWLGCATDIADLQVSGVFSLRDTDRALASLEQSLPVKTRRLTHLWVRLEANVG